jgi:hypothetical protein
MEVHLSVMFVVALVDCIILAWNRPISSLRKIAIFWQLGYVLSEPMLLISASLGDNDVGYAISSAIAAGALASIGCGALSLTVGCYEVGWKGNNGFDNNSRVTKPMYIATGVVFVIFLVFAFLMENKQSAINISLVAYMIGRVSLSIFWIAFFFHKQFGASSKGTKSFNQNLPYLAAAVGSIMFFASLSGHMWMGWAMLGVVTWAVLTIES